MPPIIPGLDRHNPLVEAFIDGAANLGIPGNHDCNGQSGKADTEERTRQRSIRYPGRVRDFRQKEGNRLCPFHGLLSLPKSIGVKVVHALPGAGEYPADHCFAPVVARASGGHSLDERTHGLFLVQEMIGYLLDDMRLDQEPGMIGAPCHHIPDTGGLVGQSE